MGFLSYTQIFLVLSFLHHIPITICQHYVEILSSHFNMFCVKITIHSNCSSCDPIWEILPVRRKVYSGLGAGRTENGKISCS
jgi:DNA polymerase sigma